MQTAENLFEHGLIDAILPVEALAEVADRALTVLTGPRQDLPDVPEVPKEQLADIPAWESITRSRRTDRPGVRALLRLGATDVLPLHGTGQGEYDPGMLMALARFGGAPCIVLGQDRDRQTLDEPLSPKGLRVARRGMKLAHELKLPLVSIIDTAGAALSKEAEEGGMAGEIARCLAELVMLDAPTVCVLLGQGTGGGALAVMPADRVISAQHSWLSPLPPEGASAILHRDTSHAPELATSQRVRSLDLLARRDRGPDRRRAPRRGRRARGVLPPDVPGHPARAGHPGPRGPGRQAGRAAGALPPARLTGPGGCGGNPPSPTAYICQGGSGHWAGPANVTRRRASLGSPHGRRTEVACGS